MSISALRPVHLAILLVTFSVSAFAALGPRRVTDEDLVEARRALQAFLPDEHKFVVARLGSGRYGDQWIHFRTQRIDDSAVVSRGQSARCYRASQDSSWGCSGPGVLVFVGGQVFPEPKDIPDDMIVTIVKFLESLCYQDQLQRGKEEKQNALWFRVRGPRVSVVSMERKGDDIVVRNGSDLYGVTFQLTTSDEPEDCGFKARPVGYWRGH